MLKPCGLMFALVASAWCQPIGVFEGHSDVGTVLYPGSVEYDAARKIYRVSGSGENMWFATDAFQFVWKKVSGDVALTADIGFPVPGGNAHRKGILMVRQSLDAESAYADAALHGDGLTSLQCRDRKGGNTREVQANISGPARLRIEKRGDTVFLSVASAGEDLRFSGGSMRIVLTEPFYIGIGVCAHEKDRVETAVFSNVTLADLAPVPNAKLLLHSTLEAVPVASGDRRVVYTAPRRLEAPVWTGDGAALLYNSDGRMLRVPVAGGKPEPVDTGSVRRASRYHGLSPDGAWLAISDQTAIYVVPAAGGAPRQVSTASPSRFHGWSPDGKTLVFSGERDGKTDIFSIPAEGGEERRLTTAKGINDDPEYSRDGSYIYFSSDRSGTMQIWRMRPDGSGQEQVTSDEWKNRFPHVSPDGRRLAFLSYEKEIAADPQDVQIRILTLSDGKTGVLASLIGGAGTFESPPWSPDGKRLAFVSYQKLPGSAAR